MRTNCGIDISDRSVEVVALERVGDTVVVSNAVRAEVPAGLIDRGIIQDPKALGLLLGAFLDAHFGHARRLHAAVSLPDLQVFSKVFNFPVQLEGEMANQAIMVEAADVMPIPLDSAHTFIHPYLPDGDRRDFYFAAIPKAVLTAYKTVMDAARVEVDLFDSEAAALARAIGRDERPVVIADIGARTTLISVVDGGLRMCANPMIGGDILTESLEDHLKMPLDQAEALKRQFGFNPIDDDGRVMLILQKPMTEIVDEIRHTISYYEKKSGRPVQAIVLAGGTSLLPNFIDYLRLNFPKVKLRRGEPFANVEFGDFPGAAEVKSQAILYATAFGLAARLVGLAEEPSTPFMVVEHKNSIFDKIGNAFRAARAGNSKKVTANVETAKPVPTPTPPPAPPAPPPLPPPAPSPVPLPSPQITPVETVVEVVPAVIAAVAAAEEPTPEEPMAEAQASSTPPEVTEPVKPAEPVPTPEPTPEPVPVTQKKPLFDGIGDILKSSLMAKKKIVIASAEPEVAPTPVVAAEPAPAPEPVPEPVKAEEAPAEPQVEQEAEEDEGPPMAVVPHELPAPEPPAPEPPTPVVEAPAPVEVIPPPPVEPEEQDFGLGIGDILDASEDIERPSPVDEMDVKAPPLTGKTGVRRLKIEEILGRRLPQEAEAETPEPREDMEHLIQDENETERRPFPWLVILLAIMFLLAAVSLYMIISKYGLPKFGQKAAAPVTEQMPVTAPATTAPSSVAPDTQLKPVSLSLLLTTDSKATAGERTLVVSRVVETDVSANATYPATGSKAAPAGTATSGTRATGTIMVTNTAGRAFTFVEKTRFVTKDGTVFRMKAKQNIAATGETSVAVYADVPGTAGNLTGPQEYTVPGLATTAWASKVTGHSDSPMTGGKDSDQPATTVEVISADDLSSAQKALTEQLAKEAVDNFGVMLSKGEVVKDDLMSGKDISLKAPTAGTVAGEFKMTLSQKYRAFLIPEEQIMAILTAKLPDLLPKESDATAYRLGKPIYTVEAYDTKAERVELRVEAPIVGR